MDKGILRIFVINLEPLCSAYSHASRIPLPSAYFINNRFWYVNSGITHAEQRLVECLVTS
jgi:hypothetical protein